MKKTRHAEEQIAFALKQAEPGTEVAEVIRRMGGTAQGFDDAQHRWKGGGGWLTPIEYAAAAATKAAG